MYPSVLVTYSTHHFQVSNTKKLLIWTATVTNFLPSRNKSSFLVGTLEINPLFISCRDSMWPMHCSPPGSSAHGDSPARNTGVGRHALRQRNLPNPGMEPRSPTLQVDSLPSEPPEKLLSDNTNLFSLFFSSYIHKKPSISIY